MISSRTLLAAPLPRCPSAPLKRNRTVCPRGPYAYGPGFAWFKLDAPATMISALEAIEEVIDSSNDQYGTKRAEMVVGGFSMGGAMSLVYTFRAAEVPRPAGVLVMSGFLPSDIAGSLDWNGELPPVLMQHGTNDPMVPLERAKRTADRLVTDFIAYVKSIGTP